MLTSIISRINKFIPIVEKGRKNLSVSFFIFGVKKKIDYFAH